LNTLRTNPLNFGDATDLRVDVWVPFLSAF
jgi:hypothetical protein